MSYVPNTPAEQQEMLRAIGAESVEDLLTAVPAEVRLKRPLDLPKAMSEAEVRRLLTRMAEENADLDHYISFLGAGSYDHIQPSVVPHLARRAEFLTSYTPYQPEISQGVLQATYEFQTMICQISGMEVANASLYDGSTAVVEAALMAVGPEGRGEVIVSRALDPQYRATLRTYAHARGFAIREVGLEDGATSIAQLRAALTTDTKAVIVQHPNFFGVLEDVREIERAVHETRALFVVAITEPASLGALEPPGSYGADIVAAEGASLGNPIGYGGPALGLFALRAEFVRRMPGRVAGQTVDDRGQTGYVLTLQTREQHIRRERATSNICTNQELLAIFASVYLSTLGKRGFADLGAQCLRRAHYAQQAICSVEGFTPLFSRPYFDEFVIACPMPIEQLNAELRDRSMIGGYDLSREYPEYENAALFCVTESRTRDDIDTLVTALQEITGAVE